jgi:hypothetical protein
MEENVQLKVMIPITLKADAAKAAVLEKTTKSLSDFVRAAITEKIERGLSQDG